MSSISKYGTKHMNIPVAFCRYLLKEKMTRLGSVYCYLLYNTSGNFLLERLDRIKLQNELGIKKWETVNRHLKKLIKLGWVYPQRQAFYLRGLASITNELEPNTILGALYDPPVFKDFKAFLVGACVTHILRSNKRRAHASGLKMRKSTGKLVSPFKLSNGQKIPVYTDAIANQYLATYLELSQTSGFNLKALAADSKYIKIRNSTYRLKVHLHQLQYFKEDNPSVAEKLFVQSGRVYLQLPQRVQSNVYLRRVKNVKRRAFILPKR